MCLMCTRVHACTPSYCPAVVFHASTPSYELGHPLVYLGTHVPAHLLIHAFATALTMLSGFKKLCVCETLDVSHGGFCAHRPTPSCFLARCVSMYVLVALQPSYFSPVCGFPSMTVYAASHAASQRDGFCSITCSNIINTGVCRRD
jgi:hypothetical protein